MSVIRKGMPSDLIRGLLRSVRDSDGDEFSYPPPEEARREEGKQEVRQPLVS
jgi:hypothetical protein